jgi:hypothetical protein
MDWHANELNKIDIRLNYLVQIHIESYNPKILLTVLLAIVSKRTSIV